MTDTPPSASVFTFHVPAENDSGNDELIMKRVFHDREGRQYFTFVSREVDTTGTFEEVAKRTWKEAETLVDPEVDVMREGSPYDPDRTVLILTGWVPSTREEIQRMNDYFDSQFHALSQPE